MAGEHSKYIYIVNSSDMEIIEFINRRIKECAPSFRPTLIASPYVDSGVVYMTRKDNYITVRLPDWGKHDYDERSEELRDMIRN